MGKLTYTTTVNVANLKKDLRWYKEQKIKLKKLIEASKYRLKGCKYSRDVALEEYQLKLLETFCVNISATIRNIQNTIQKERQNQYNNAKKYAESKGMEISVVKETMLKYNKRMIDKD